MNFLELNLKTWKYFLKLRGHRHFAADCYECKTLKQFFKIKYWYPLINKLFLVKSRKTNELFHELHHISIIIIVYPRKAA